MKYLDYPYVYQCPECNKDAFYLDYKPKAGDVIYAKGILIKGKPAKETDIVACQNCNHMISTPMADAVKKREF